MNQKKSLFSVSDEIKNKLKLDFTNKRNFTVEIIDVFKAGEKEGKYELTVDEVTAAYYNLFTEGTNYAPKTKKAIGTKLFLMKKTEDNPNGEVEIVEKQRGIYRLTKKTDEKA